VCSDTEPDLAASTSTALPMYSFDSVGVGGSFTPLGSSFSAAADSGRYIQDDLPLTTVTFPDGSSLPLSSFAVNSSGFVSAGMVDDAASTVLGASHGQAHPMVAAAGQLDSHIGGSDSLPLGVNVSGTMTSEELSQFLQNGSVFTEMQTDEFLHQLDGVTFQPGDGTSGLPQSSKQ